MFTRRSAAIAAAILLSSPALLQGASASHAALDCGFQQLRRPEKASYMLCAN